MGSRRPFLCAGREKPVADLSINELILAYWKHAEAYYGFDGERGDEGCFRSALRVVRESYGHTLAAAFGPLALKACRQMMVEKAGRGTTSTPRSIASAACFAGPPANSCCPGASTRSSKSVAGLRRGKTEARETARVKPASPDHVEAALPFMPNAVRGLVRFQQLTGCRPAEACLLRAIDLDMTNPTCWVYRPGSDQGPNGEHKTAHHGHDRLILIGPKSQELVRAYLKTDLNAYLFCPKDARAERNEKVRARRSSPGRSVPAEVETTTGAGRPLHRTSICPRDRTSLPAGSGPGVGPEPTATQQGDRATAIRARRGENDPRPQQG